MKERDVIERNVKRILEKFNCFRRYSIVKCTYVSKNSNKMTKWRDIKKSKLHNSWNNWNFQKKNFTFYSIASCFLKIIYLFCHISWNFNCAVNLETSFSRQKTLKSKNKKHRSFWNTKFYHPAEFKLKKIKNVKVFLPRNILCPIGTTAN